MGAGQNGFDGNNNGDTDDSGAAGSLTAQNVAATPGNFDTPSYSSLDVNNLPAGMLPPSSLAEDGTLGLGGAGFRENAIPIIVASADRGTRFRPEAGGVEPDIVSRLGDSVSYIQITENGKDDTPFDDGDEQIRSLSEGARVVETFDALTELHPLTTVIGLGTGVEEEPMFRAIARATGGVNETNIPIPRSVGNAVPDDDLADGSMYLSFNQSNPGEYAAAIGDAVRAGVRLHATLPPTVLYGAPGIAQFSTAMTTGGAELIAPTVNTNTIDLTHASVPADAKEALFNTALTTVDDNGTPTNVDDLLMSFGAANGHYTLELYFAETEGYLSGQRQFDIRVEGAVLESAVDIAAEVGANKAIVKSFPVTITDGRLDVSLESIVGDAPILSGLRLAYSTPRVLDVTLSGSTSTHEPYSFAEAMQNPSWVAGDQLKTVPVGGVDTVSITFSEDVNIASTDLSVIGLRTANLPQLAKPEDFSYDPMTHTATWKLTGWDLGDHFVISLNENITDTSGNALDGEWTNPANVNSTSGAVSNFVAGSGNGVLGGSFQFVVTLLPGDADQNAIVELSDLNTVLFNFYVGILFAEGDFDGNGVTDLSDYNTVLFEMGIDLQSIWIIADFDGDLDVDDDDAAIWSANFGMQSGATQSDGDTDGDGDVDLDDFWALLGQTGIDLLTA